VIWIAESELLRGDAALQWTILQKSGVDQTALLGTLPADGERLEAKLANALAEAAWIVDALFGTGLSRPVEGVMSKVIEAMNAGGRPILALDLPSGLDADTGEPLGKAIRAFATATFAAPKLGFTARGAAEYTGRVAVIDIGLPRCLLEPYFA
jgi:NAD(P)H-hydrate epimerase